MLERVGVEGMTCHVAELFVPSLLVLLRLLEYVVGRGVGVPDRNITDNAPILQATRLKNVKITTPSHDASNHSGRVWHNVAGKLEV